MVLKDGHVTRERMKKGTDKKDEGLEVKYNMNKSKRDRVRNADVRRNLGVESVRKRVGRSRLREIRHNKRTGNNTKEWPRCNHLGKGLQNTLGAAERIWKKG